MVSVVMWITSPPYRYTPTPLGIQPRSPPSSWFCYTKRMKLWGKLLIALECLVGVTAAGGGIGLITTDGLGMPVSWLKNSPFPSYLIPGLILFFAVGGTNICAAAIGLKNYRHPYAASAVAGFGLLIWIFTEIYIIGHSHWLQFFYFGTGILILILAMLTNRDTGRKTDIS